jgi:outer membrane lipoprotein-sorting protein
MALVELFRGIGMKHLLWCAAVAALIVPSATQAQSPRRAELATKLLAIVQKDAQPNSGTYSVVGTATVGSQTKVYLQQKFETSGKTRHVNSEYTCTTLDDEAGWICTNASQPQGLILVR